MTVTAYLGPEGTFAEQAARGLVPAGELRSAVSVHAAIAALRARQVDAACVPVENSVEGSVPATLDAMVEGEPVLAVAEAVLPVQFSVLIRPGTDAADVRTVATHPHAAAQVRCWLGTHLPDATTMLTDSTSAAAVAVLENRADAAVCAPVALAHYPLAELAAGVHDKEDAKTRFLLLRRPGTLPPPTGTDRTSLVAVAADRPGALLEVLAEFALRGINLTRIESRPMKAKLGEYQFFLDCEGHVAEDAVGDALAELHRRCAWVRFLGSYPRVGASRPGPDPAGFSAARHWLRAVRAGRSA
ncbi:MAG TPA: prephenate dehydratase [Pseudonocardiaceae bacterium]